MLSYKVFNRDEVTDELLEPYKQIIPKKTLNLFLEKLPRIHAGSAIHFVEVRKDEQVIAVLVFTFPPNNEGAEILSFDFVDPTDAAQNIDEILKWFESLTEQDGRHNLIYKLDQNHENYETITTTFSKHNWKGPKLFCMRYLYVVKFYNDALLQISNLPNGYEIFPWKEVTEEEKQEIQSMMIARQMHPMISPFESPETVEAINSLGLRYNGNIVGWMVTNRSDDQTINYSILYVEDEHRSKGFSKILLGKAISLQKASPVPFASFELRLDKSPVEWQKFIIKELHYKAQKIGRTFILWKNEFEA